MNTLKCWITSPPFGREKCCPSSLTSTGECFIGHTSMILLQQEQNVFGISLDELFSKEYFFPCHKHLLGWVQYTFPMENCYQETLKKTHSEKSLWRIC